METFIKENWFKVGLIAVILIAILVYLLSWRPAEKREIELANNIKCQQEGSQLHEREGKVLPENQSYGEPEFKFIPNLNTCLYKTSMFSSGEKAFSVQRFIKNVYTNETLAFYIILNIEGEESGMLGDKTEYERVDTLYFDK